jgi:hypothetical protein
MQLSAERRIDELHRVHSEPLDELLASRMGLIRHLDDGRAQREPRARREILGAEVQIEKELIPGPLPAIAIRCDQLDHTRAHDVQLHVGVRSPIRGAGASAQAPAITDEAKAHVELGDVDDFSLIDARPADDEVKTARILRRLKDGVQTRFELGHAQMDGA